MKTEPEKPVHQTKGVYFRSIKDFIQDRFGQESWESFLNQVPSEVRETLQTAVSIAWIDMQIRLRTNRCLVEHLANGDKSIMTDHGRFRAERDLTTIKRMFMRMANPGYLMEKAAGYWRQFFNFGSVTINRKSKTEASLTLVDMPFRDELFCRELEGYLARMFELAGAKDMKVIHSQCRSRGDTRCIFEGTWQ